MDTEYRNGDEAGTAHTDEAQGDMRATTWLSWDIEYPNGDDAGTAQTDETQGDMWLSWHTFGTFRVRILGRSTSTSDKCYYRIEVRQGHGPVCHVVQRRYMEFDQLSSEIRGKCPNLPELPPKSVFRKAFSKRFNDERERDLNKFISCAVGADPLLSDAALRRFLGLAENGNEALPTDELGSWGHLPSVTHLVAKTRDLVLAARAVVKDGVGVTNHIVSPS
jgi:hypothetical protein